MNYYLYRLYYNQKGYGTLPGAASKHVLTVTTVTYGTKGVLAHVNKSYGLDNKGNTIET